MRVRLIVGLIVIIGLAAGLVYWLQIPRLIEVTPQNGADNISAGEPLRLVFSHPMDTASVDSQLEIKPAQTGKSVWQGNAYVFYPDHPWQNDTTYHIRLTKGARAKSWLKLATTRENSWFFTIEEPLLAYLYPGDGPAQVFTINPTSGEQIQITGTSGEVLDFNVSANGGMIYYSLNLGGKGSALYSLDRTSGQSTLLLECPLALCRGLKVSPHNDFLAYERTPLAENNQTDKPQVWMAALPSRTSSEEGDTAVLLSPKPVGDPQHQTQQPLWSPSGWLAFYDFTLSEYTIQNPQGEAIARFPSQTGQPGDWDTAGASFIFPEFVVTPQASSALSDLNPIPSSHLLRYYLDGEKPVDLTIMDYLEDSAPAFSPDGKWLIFARKFIDAARWTPGRQIWILLLDSGEAYPITDEPLYNHYAFSWNPNSQQIAYVRFDQTKLTEPPEIWLTDLDGSNQHLLVRNGYAPQWIP